MTAILLVEDDAEMVSLLGRFLPEEGYEVRVAGDMASTLRALSEFEPDLILLDVVLGSEDGRDILREIREVNDVPAIFLTGRGLESDRIAGLERGADDYIVKPVRMDELLARLRAHLRNFERSEAMTLRIGPYTFHPAKKSLINPNRNKRILLTAKETALLKCLCRASGQSISRAALKNEIWGLNDGGRSHAHAVEDHIYRMRQKMALDAELADLLVSDHAGYRLGAWR